MTQSCSFKTRPARGNLHSCRGGPSAELLDQGEKIRDTPVLCDLTVVHSHRVHGFKMDFSTRRRHTQEGSLVCSMIGLVSRHYLPVSGLPMDLCAEIRKCRPKGVVKDSHTVFIRSGVRLGRMVDEIFGKELLEQFEVSASLHFFGIPADSSLNLNMIR